MSRRGASMYSSISDCEDEAPSQQERQLQQRRPAQQRSVPNDSRNRNRPSAGNRSANTIISDETDRVGLQQNQRRAAISHRQMLNSVDDQLDEPEQDNDNFGREIEEIKEDIKILKRGQASIIERLVKIQKVLEDTSIDIGDCVHTDNIIKVFSRAYIQLGRFPREHENKESDLRVEFLDSPTGLSQDRLLELSQDFEKHKFSYWRTEERRRILGLNQWRELKNKPTVDVVQSIERLLKVRTGSQLHKSLKQEIVYLRKYIRENNILEDTDSKALFIGYYNWVQANQMPALDSPAWACIVQEDKAAYPRQ